MSISLLLMLFFFVFNNKQSLECTSESQKKKKKKKQLQFSSYLKTNNKTLNKRNNCSSKKVWIRFRILLLKKKKINLVFVLRCCWGYKTSVQWQHLLNFSVFYLPVLTGKSIESFSGFVLVFFLELLDFWIHVRNNSQSEIYVTSSLV